MGTSASSSAGGITAAERAQIQRANVSGLHPVVFVHGLWLLPESWLRWAELFEEAGYIALTPGWPGDPASVAEANANPDAMAGNTVGQVADHLSTIISQLERKPVVIGHSFGGLLAQILAGRGRGSRRSPCGPDWAVAGGRPRWRRPTAPCCPSGRTGSAAGRAPG